VGVAHPFACVVVAWPSKLRFKTKIIIVLIFLVGLLHVCLFVHLFVRVFVDSVNKQCPSGSGTFLCQHDSFIYHRPPLAV
jgi:hypothetical protein